MLRSLRDTPGCVSGDSGFVWTLRSWVENVRPRASSMAAVLLARTTAPQLLERACATYTQIGREALAAFARRVLHVSAAARRGAAAYADGSERLVGPRTHDSLLV